MAKFKLFFLILLLGACSKFEDGPAISFRSRTARISRTWTIQSVTELSSNLVITSGFEDETYTFENNGEYSETDKVQGSDVRIDGNWKFSSDINLIITKPVIESGDTVLKEISFDIMRLSSKELWLKDSLKETRLVRK